MKATILIDNNTKDDLLPEWGLSAYIEHEGHKVLLDTGASGKFAENAKSLGIDLADVECGVLSHAHYDHSDGMAAFFERNKKAPFYLRKGAGENCYRKNKILYHYIGIQKGCLKAFKDRIVYAEGDKEILPGVWLIPHKTLNLDKKGKIARMYVRKGIRWWTPDDFSHEQSLVIDTKDGLVVFNSCSHGGADSIIEEIGRTWPDKKIAVLIGGLHLFRSSDEKVHALAERVKATGIGKIYTGHCTGDRALEILKEELGERVEPLYTGLKIKIGE